jgi:hypothetical protein
MIKYILFALALIASTIGTSQSTEDVFKSGDYDFHWLGIDYSHVSLVGDFSEFAAAGNRSAVQIQKTYFPKWNYLIISEPDKYDIRGMMRKSGMKNSIEMIMKKNAAAAVDDMETYEPRSFTEEEVVEYCKEYDSTGMTGIGFVLMAESMNKFSRQAVYHLVAIDMSNNHVLLQKRLDGKPMGFGLRNYWAGSIYSVIKQIKSSEYMYWKRHHAGK